GSVDGRKNFISSRGRRGFLSQYRNQSAFHGSQIETCCKNNLRLKAAEGRRSPRRFALNRGHRYSRPRPGLRRPSAAFSLLIICPPVFSLRQQKVAGTRLWAD